MEVTIWIERGLELNVIKVVSTGCTVGELKAELLSEDFLGGLSAADLRLVAPGRPASEALADHVVLTEDLRELDIAATADPEEDLEPSSALADVEEAPTGVLEGEDIAAPGMEELPRDLGIELKWYVWNAMWHAANTCHAEHNPPRRAELEAKANDDSGRVSKHWATLIGSSLLSEDTLLHIQRKVGDAGREAATAFLKGNVYDPERMEIGATPREFEEALWSSLVAAMGHAASSISNCALVDKYKGKETKHDQERLWHFWGQTQYQQGLFEEGFHGTFDRPPSPPPEKLQEQKAQAEKDAAAKQAELEKKALQMKDTVIRTGKGAKKLLGTPLVYHVLRDCPVYCDPMPQAKQITSVRQGEKIVGYPGSAAWILVDAHASKLPKEALLVPMSWIPVRAQDGAWPRELVLHAHWHELNATKTYSDAIQVTWPGVGQPVEPNVAEYTVEVRANVNVEGVASAVPAVSGTTKTRAVVRGLINNADVEVRVNVKIVGPYTTDFRLTGPWKSFRTAESVTEEEAVAAAHAQAAQAAAEKGAIAEDTEPEGVYQVVNTFVTLRGEPTTTGTIKGTLKMGATVFAKPFMVGEEPWVKLTPQTIPAAVANMPPRDVSEEDNIFVLIDASTIPSLKLGVLMKRVGEAEGAKNKKLGKWKIIVDKVDVKEKADMTSKLMGFQKKGSTVIGVCIPINGVDWLRVQNPKISGVASPDAWMPIDGSSLTPAKEGVLLERVGDAPPDLVAQTQKSMPKVANRPHPPCPLTTAWLAAHGGLPGPPRLVREEKLDADVDVGMASQCSLVVVQPADGSPEVSYVAKRGPPHGDMNSCGREYRFYTEVMKKDGKSQPEMLGGVMRLPRCLCANWGKQGKEREAFILIMERLDPPDWVSVDAEIGCTFEQAKTALETLGRMHKAFQNNVPEWLPYTAFDVRNADGIQQFFRSIRQAAQPLVEMLPPGAQKTVETMADGGLGESFVRLSEYPVTLCHGDYRPENLRFSPPGKPLAVGVFDWGLVNCSKGMSDFAYFVMLSQPPEKRREWEKDLMRAYLEAREDKVTQRKIDEEWQNLKSASIAILGQILMTRQFTKEGYKQQTRNMLSRMMRWVGEAIQDWRSEEALDSSYYRSSLATDAD